MIWSCIDLEHPTGNINSMGCWLEGKGSTGGVSQTPSTFQVILADILGNPVLVNPGNFLQTAVEPTIDVEFRHTLAHYETLEEEQVVEFSVERIYEDCCYNITYSAPISGIYRLCITLDDDPIQDSPRMLTIVKGIAEEDQRQSSDPVCFPIQAQVPEKDAYSNHGIAKEGAPKRHAKELSYLEQIIHLQAILRLFLARKQREALGWWTIQSLLGY